MCDGTPCPCNLYPEFPGGKLPAGMSLDEIWETSRRIRLDRDLRQWWNPAAMWRAWQAQRACMHGEPSGGTSYVISLGLIDLGRAKLFECSIAAGGCGRRWT